MKPSEELKAKINELNNIMLEFEQYGIHNLRVFGSVARGDDNEGSDIDFAVDIGKGINGRFPGFKYFEIPKKAYVRTLRPGCEIRSENGIFTLSSDRKKLSCKRFSLFSTPFRTKGNFAHIEIEVTEGMACEIFDDDMVADDTVLV